MEQITNQYLYTYPSNYHYIFNQEGSLIRDTDEIRQELLIDNNYFLLTTKECNVCHTASLLLNIFNISNIIELPLEKVINNGKIDWKINQKDGNEVFEISYLSDLYSKESIIKLPVLYDIESKCIVNNSLELPKDIIGLILNDTTSNHSNFIQEDNIISEQFIEQMESALFECLFTHDLRIFNEKFDFFFNGLDIIEDRLSINRFLMGDYVKYLDIRLFTLLIRFDSMYSRYINPVKSRIFDYKNIFNYLRDIYQIPEIYNNTYLKDYIASRDIDNEYTGYWVNTYYDIVLPQMDLDSIYKLPVYRTTLSKDPYNKIV